MPQLKRALPALLCCLLTAVGLWLLYDFDNKYTQQAPLTQDGVVYVDVGAAMAGALSVPASGWTLWPDALLDPEALDAAGPGMPVWIGQYLTLRPFHADGSPYGTSTWRLRLYCDGAAQLSLLVPEAFCASAVWVDGVYLGGTGTVSPYAPRVMDAIYSFPAEGGVEVVIQTANDTHYYSGLIYPPVVGSPAAVGRYVALRTALYGLLCFASLAVALFSAAVWLGVARHRDPVHLWFGLLCLAYGLRVCYPFLRAAGVPLIRPLYALEDLGAFLLLYCGARLVCLLSGRGEGGWARYALFPAALGMCAVGVAVPLWILPALPAFSGVYGGLVTGYKLVMALALLLLALQGVGRRGGRLALCGIGIYGVTQLCAALWAGSFEPLWGPWPEEYGGFALVLCFALLMAGRSRAMARENAVLTQNLQAEVERMTADLTAISAERRRLLSGLLHDLKSPLAAVQGYAELVRENDVALDRDSREKLDLILAKCRDLGGRVRAIQNLNTEEPVLAGGDRVDLSALVRQVWVECAPDLEAGGADLLLALPAKPCVVWGDGGRLKSALENLVSNAASYTPAGGRVTLTLRPAGREVFLEVRDTGPGIPPDVLPQIFQRGFTTRAALGGEGLGLSLVQTVVQSHGGRVWAVSLPEGGAAVTIALPWTEREERT